MRARIEIGGQRFGKWTVISHHHDGMWLCRCECGAEGLVESHHLRTRKNPGCMNCRDYGSTHGGTYTRLYGIWRTMRSRCGNPTVKNYARYGGRGITVCESWAASFEVFRDWGLANGYEDDLTIERRDNDGNYEPSNCCWITRAAQNRNRRDNVRYQFRGQELLIPEIAEIVGLDPRIIWQRVKKYGLSIDDAVAGPIRRAA